MTDSLFDIPESVPIWQQLAVEHGIELEEDQFGLWRARFSTVNDDDREFATVVSGCETAREAVVTLLHHLKLPGWETVSARG